MSHIFGISYITIVASSFKAFPKQFNAQNLIFQYSADQQILSRLNFLYNGQAKGQDIAIFILNNLIFEHNDLGVYVMQELISQFFFLKGMKNKQPQHRVQIFV